MKVVLLAIILYCFNLVTGSNHYWRDFNGTMPSDAIIDVDTNLAVAQISAVGGCAGLIPAGLNRFTKVADAECGGGRLATTKHLKVLCTPNPEKYYWQWSNVTRLLYDHNLVACGYEDGIDELLYMGKVFKNGAWVLGKVVTNKAQGGYFIGHDDGVGFKEDYVMILKLL